MNLSRSETTKAMSLLKQLERVPESFEFRHPVDYVNLGLTDYLYIVKKPMDISTVKSKLADGAYEVIEEVVNDIQLIWDNCKLYNSPESFIAKQAASLEETMKSGCVEMGLPAPGAPERHTKVLVPTEEKLEMASLVQRASPNTLVYIVSIVETECSAAALHLDKERVLIKLDELTFRVYSKLRE